MRLVVARCEVLYTGRLTTALPEAVRLLMFKSDGSVLVHDDSGAYKSLNWMSGPAIVKESEDSIIVRKPSGKTEDCLEIRLVEIISEVEHDMGQSVALQKDGAERHLQEELAARPEVLEDGLRLVRREWPTDIGPVDLMCCDEHGAWVAVEVKRVATIEAVEQLCRYLERIDGECRGVLAAQNVKPQARTLAESRDIRCVEVDLAVLR
jgi:endonuclease